MIKEVENPVLETHNLTVVYDRKPAIWNIDFTLPAGSIVGIMGPNGSGKSTLLKSIMGVVEPNSGYARLFNKPLDAVRKRVSYVPQRQSVDWDFPASVLDVVTMGRYPHLGLFRKLRSEDKEIVADSLEKVGMLAFANRQISQLSGGQQQRVFLARALAQQADLYLMDEPLVGVDAASEHAIIDLLKQMQASGKTIVVVHHDLYTASEYFDWLVLMNTRLVASAPLEEVFQEEMLRDAYGGQLTSMSKIAALLREKSFPMRHK
ncbi:MAG: metal ABC transporter ATP-binding protein [Flavobacteriales bacterium]|nr:metal ABC transporter ATP-binding protein [Flavobacteriales bacterium]